ncbi:hypothetical protein M758_1G110000 [Ceratodon purpureus]|nr:hypothetical protein M758_1G110000 [Ceratodon purpureus]
MPNRLGTRTKPEECTAARLWHSRDQLPLEHRAAALVRNQTTKSRTESNTVTSQNPNCSIPTTNPNSIRFHSNFNSNFNPIPIPIDTNPRLRVVSRDRRP